jgi:AcrR family transcriptional regulator
MSVVELELKDSTQRVLDVAEALFMEQGYTAISLRDIADALGMKQASLYYHFPGGKEQLFMAMAERMFDRHRAGLTQALEEAGPHLQAQLAAVAAWFGSQRPLNLMGMMHADLAALTPENTERLARIAHGAVFFPLRQAIVAAAERGEIRPMHPDLLAGSFLWLMDGLRYGETRMGAPPREAMAEELVSLLMDGMRPRTIKN